jgi:hypothetical protein
MKTGYIIKPETPPHNEDKLELKKDCIFEKKQQ